MKLIIDIPEEDFNNIKKSVSTDAYHTNDLIDIAENIANGTPFDSVIEEERKKYNDIALDLLGEVEHYEKAIEDIKAEITSKYDSIPFKYIDYDDGWIDGLEWVLSVIDKHISGKEQI